MALAILPVQDQIITKLEELPQQVFSTTAPEETALTYDSNGMLLPYIVVTFSSMVSIAAERGITGPRQDLGRAFAVVEVVGPTDRSVRQVMDLIVDKLTGFQPTDAGYMTPENVGKPYMDTTSASRPVKYVSEIVFSFAVNTVVS